MSFLDWFHRFEQYGHAQALALLNLTPAEREDQVHSMLAARQRGVVEYWTFLMLSMAIATLGLAMDSTTVVIGAMLVSPLMGPIVEFAMGLVVGSPVLTVRSVLRILGSVLVVVAGAALMTLVLPFHEVTPEIAARTEPTLMDLALAGFVALAATLTVVKARSETNIVAAGAAIGIALVPPVCVVGFGLGIGDLEIAGGASLLLVTNFTAIIFVGVVFFYLLGYERVSVQEWDREALEAAAPGSTIRRVLMGADRIFGSARSRLFRVLVPGLVFGLLALPLSRALDRVAWEVRTRSAVRSILADLPGDRDVLHVSHSVGSGQVTVRTFVVGSTLGAADSLQSALVDRIVDETDVDRPVVRVVALPNQGALRQVMEQRATEPAVLETSPDVELAGIRQGVRSALERTWPTGMLGPLVGWRMELSPSDTVILHLHHLGPAPDSVAAFLMGRSLGADVPTNLRVLFTAVDTATVRAGPGDALGWLPELARTLETARAAPAVMVCVQLPDPEVLRRSPPDARTVASLAPGLLSGLPGERFSLRSEGDDFVVRLRHPTGAAPAIRRAPAGGAATDGAATGGAATGGVATDGVATDGVATDGVATDVTATGGAATDGVPPEARLPDPGSC